MCGVHIPLAPKPDVTVRRLSADRIMQAFPLVRESSRCVSSSEWKDYAATFLDGSGDERWPAGIMVAEQPNGCIVGLFSYFVRPCLRAGRVLAVADLAAVAPFGREVVADRLLGSIGQLARRHEVAASEVVPAPSSAWWAGVFRKHGFVLDDRRRLVWQTSDSEALAP
jgi:hypothetical protein